RWTERLALAAARKCRVSAPARELPIRNGFARLASPVNAPHMPIERLTHLADPAAAHRIVLKVGSALLVGSEGKPDRAWLATLVAEIAEARQRGQQVIVVSSGSIALGAVKLGLPKRGRGSLADAQAAAAVGQIALAGLWSELLEEHGLTAAQLL